MSSSESEFKDIINYYDHTRSDYRVAWDDSPMPAVHFGYYITNTEKHVDALMNTNKVLADRVNIKPGEKVLDAGCGKGGSSFWLATHRDVETVGITPVFSQIEDCKAQAQILNLVDKTTFVQADYCNTPFEDQSFDVVWACESLCHAKDKSKFYKEAFRLLRPGGRIIIAEYVRNERPLKREEEDLLMSWLNKWAIDDIDTGKEHLAHATAAGFHHIFIDDVTEHMEKSLQKLHDNSRKWLKLSRLLNMLKIRSDVQQENMVASITQYQALKKKLWHYAFISAEKR